MELQQLRYFLSASRTASFALTAEEFNVSRQAISSSIKSLKSELNIELFDRSHNRIVLLPEAEEFARRAQETVELFEQIETRFHAPVIHNLALVLDSFLFEPETHVLNSLFEYSELEGGCPVQLAQVSFDRVCRLIENRSCDIGIVRGMEPPVPNCECVTLRAAFLGCIVSEKSELAENDCISVDDIKGRQLILPSAFERRYTLLPEELQFSDFLVSAIDEKKVATDAVRCGMGIGTTDFLSKEAKRQVVDGIVKIPFEDGAYCVFDLLLYRRDNPKRLQIEHFVSWMTENDCWRVWKLSHTI